ncbi:MAG: hypothetical protein M1812_002595 [Candelaria pacifica]|nr:MAG: hypothetical protein M1812_002595 [Candelaria pacifica]
MRQCLTSPDGGYYTSKPEGRDQFGQRGDFITSPEISQMFGELVGVWIVAEMMAQGRPSKRVELIEVGPGRGSLMDDMLRTIHRFKALASTIGAIYLIESSPSLREAQRRLLCGDAPMTETGNGFQSTSKHLNVPVFWCEDIRFVPSGTGKAPYIIAHEFFDALPIHAFQSVAPSQTESSTPIPSSPIVSAKVPRVASTVQWRELLVSPAPPSPIERFSESTPEFQLSLSKASTPNSLVLPEISQRYKALKAQVSSTIEICPEGHSYAEEFSRRIGGTGEGPTSSKPEPSGAALILDYGPADTVPINSLRGIRAHDTVSPFSSPGLVDISADVDFAALAEAALKASPGVEVHGPVEQGFFLQSMGIEERAKQLTSSLNADETEKRERLDSGWRRLVERGGGGMGKIYKAMAIVPNRGGVRKPVGFGGGVAI